jgi:glucose-6-phosphate 1-dehydrogenase
MVLGPARLTFAYDRSFQSDNQLSGYERLIYNAMLGDQTFFTRSDGIERLWEAAVPLLADPPPVKPYPPGSWGPAAIDDLVRPFRWHLGQD